MAVIVTPDIMDGASIEVAPGNIRATRIFLVENIPTTVPRALLPLALAADGVPKWGEVHPEIQTVSVQRFTVRSTGEPFSAFIEVAYEQAQFQNFSTWYIVDDFVVSQEMADRNPVGEQIRAIFTQPGIAGDTGKKIAFPGFVPRMVTHRTLTVSGLLRKPPGGGVLAAVEGPTVNSKLWMGHERGWWMCTRCRVDAHLTGNRLAQESGIQAKGVGISAVFNARYRNWMEFLVYRSPDGRPSQVSPKVAREAYEAKYVYDQVEYEKITAIGQYAMVDFRGVFGFGETGEKSAPIGNAWGSKSSATNIF